MYRFAALLLCAVALPCAAMSELPVHNDGHTPAPAARAALERGRQLEQDGRKEEALAAYFEAVEADPDYLHPHDALTWYDTQWFNAARTDPGLKARAEQVRKTIRDRYAEWERRYPDALGILYWFGSTYAWEEDSRATPYLLKLVERAPRLVAGYYYLALDAEFRGDTPAAMRYTSKAAELDPQNPELAFRHAINLHELAPERFESAMQDVARRFPDHERGAQALYWLGNKLNSDARRIAVWEQLLAQFPPGKFSWSDSGRRALFEPYLRTDPARAVRLAQAVLQEKKGTREEKEWAGRAALAQSYVEIRRLIAEGKAAQAVSRLDALNWEGYSTNAAMLSRLKAQVLEAAGQGQRAYEGLLQRQVTGPDEENLAAMVRLGQGLRKTREQVEADIRAALDAGARPAPPFDLETYVPGETVSLEQFRGKVVFVTFWYPACGPCRAEFPHFETVMRHFKGRDVVYLGINGRRGQDGFVPEFMERTGYSFIPLKGTDAVLAPEAYNVRSYPANFLIDRKGRIVYSNFRATEDIASQRTLKRMIESLL